MYKLENKLKSNESNLKNKSDDEGNESKCGDVPSIFDHKINVPFVSTTLLFYYDDIFVVIVLVTYFHVFLCLFYQIVSAGIQTLFDIISETKHQYPAICSKALSSLFDIFQGN